MKGPGNSLHFQMSSHILHNPQSSLLKTQLPTLGTSGRLTDDIFESFFFFLSPFCYPTFILASRDIHTLKAPGAEKLIVTASRGEDQARGLDLRMENRCSSSSSPSSLSPGQKPEEE